VRLLLLAPPGAGKGTQGERLAAWSGVRHIAAGDLLRAEAAAGGGYILDGFPRTLPQATAAAELGARLGVTLHAAIYLHAPEPVLTQRLLDRASQGGRSDDKADVIRHRLQVFAATTGPLVPYYTERGILVAVDADQSPDSVTAGIQAGLSRLSLT
jgi:adenylate kinase